MEKENNTMAYVRKQDKLKAKTKALSSFCFCIILVEYSFNLERSLRIYFQAKRVESSLQKMEALSSH